MGFILSEFENYFQTYLTPTKDGFSPGAVFSDITFNELTWVKASTVAATNHGKPRIEETAIDAAIMNKSK